MRKLLVLIFFLLGILFSGNLNAQTPVERSKNITEVGGKEYYLHTVLPGQTLWGLSRAYNVTIEEIELMNPEVKKNGLKAGHVVGIPVRPLPEKPVVNEPKPEPEPEPVAVEPEPESVVVDSEPEPIVVEPESEPVVVEPEPEPEPIVVEPEPDPEPVVVEPEPDPIVVEPEPEPVVVEPEPEPVIMEPEPEPIVVDPEPEPESVVVEPGPEPEIVVVEPDPELEPVVKEPENLPIQSDLKAFYDGTSRIVQPGEDLYDIAKEYGIGIAEFKAINRGLSDEPAVGTHIIIPNIVNETDYILHNCDRNEKVTSLLKRWKVDEKVFRKKNVSVGSHVFEGQVVLIPITPITDFYWVSEQPTQIVENEVEIPEQPIQPVEEEPVVVEEEQPQPVFYDDFEPEPECFAAHENAYRRYKVALMVPLYLNEVANLEVSKENLPKLQKARSLSFLQFYEGFMMAVEELENEGLKLDLTVIDVTDNVGTAQNALSQIRGKDLDLIVGPFFGKSFAVIEEYAKANNIVVVNPLSTRGSVVDDNPNVVKVKPGDIGQILVVSNLVKNYYFDSNVFIISREKSSDSAFLNQLEHHLNLVVNDEVSVSGDAFLQFARNESQRLEMGNRMVSTVDVEGQVYSVNDFKTGTTERVMLNNSVKRYCYDGENLGKLRSQLSGVRNNLLVAYGDDNVFATQVLNALAKETDRYPITLVALPDWAKFEKLLVDNLLQLNAIYLGDGFVDYNGEEAKRFVLDFREKYVVEPQMYAFEGYDMATFFLNALMRYGDDMLECLNCCDVPMLHTRYRFFNRNHMRWEEGNGRENQYWSVYQYDKESIELKPIDPFKKQVE